MGANQGLERLGQERTGQGGGRQAPVWQHLPQSMSCLAEGAQVPMLGLWGAAQPRSVLSLGSPKAVADRSPPTWPSSENDTIYWVDMGLSTISRAKRDQTWREDVVTNGIGRVEGIAVDWIAGEGGGQAERERRGSGRHKVLTDPLRR